MYLQKIILSNFKNIAEAQVSFSPNINCICGNNGMGKTNLLDAIHYLSMTKSFLLPNDKFIYTHGKSMMTAFGEYRRNGLEEKIAIKVSDNNDKQVKRNQKTYSKISEHIGFIPVVTISPNDSSLINDSAEERRRFVNIILSQIDKEYLKSLQVYNKVLLSRNKLLKQENVSELLMESVSAPILREAQYIFKRRKELLELLSLDTTYFYSKLSNSKEQISLIYKSDLDGVSMDELLSSNYKRDAILGYTSKGLHKDDVELCMDGFPVKKCASQGQQKCFLIALKLAQYSIMKKIYGFPPILLLDDIFDKLDLERVECLINLVSNEDFGQIFISDTNRERVTKIVDSITSDSAYFSVEHGVITRDNIL